MGEREEPTNPSGRAPRRLQRSEPERRKTSTLFEVRGRTRVVVLAACVVLGVMAYRLASALLAR
jgi:hypothetical protein